MIADPKARINVVGALRDAAWTALVAFGLFLPLIGFDTVTNIRNELILETRFGLLAVIVALIAAGSLVNSLVVAPWRAGSPRSGSVSSSSIRRSCSRSTGRPAP